MKTWFRALALAGLCLAVPAASGEAVREAEVAPPPAPAVETAVAAAPEAAVVLDPAADAQPLGFVPSGDIGGGGGDDQIGTCVIYCDGQPYPFGATYGECCGGGHVCPDGNFPSGGNTYWQPSYGSPTLCMY